MDLSNKSVFLALKVSTSIQKEIDRFEGAVEILQAQEVQVESEIGKGFRHPLYHQSSRYHR